MFFDDFFSIGEVTKDTKIYNRSYCSSIDWFQSKTSFTSFCVISQIYKKTLISYTNKAPDGPVNEEQF